MEQKFKLWENKDVEISYYRAIHRSSDSAAVILPGGGYTHRAPHEGEGFAQLFNTFGMDAFVVHYRVSPNRFPLPLLDARRAIRFVRSKAEELNIDKGKILLMGSSAGGHLTALTSTYFEKIEGEGVDEIDNEDFLPNAQVLCYPVISSEDKVTHQGSFINLLGDRYNEKDKFSLDKNVSEKTPPVFIWHTAADQAVNVKNTYLYASALSEYQIPHEVHVFPYGTHGQGLGAFDPHIAQWTGLLRNWLSLNKFIR